MGIGWVVGVGAREGRGTELVGWWCSSEVAAIVVGWLDRETVQRPTCSLVYSVLLDVDIAVPKQAATTQNNANTQTVMAVVHEVEEARSMRDSSGGASEWR